MVTTRGRKTVGAFHEPPLSRPSATLSPPCGERAGRGVANLVHGPNACAKANEAFHEHGPNAAQGANSANRLSEAATRLSARRVDVSFEPVKEKSNLWL